MNETDKMLADMPASLEKGKKTEKTASPSPAASADSNKIDAHLKNLKKISADNT